MLAWFAERDVGATRLCLPGSRLYSAWRAGQGGFVARRFGTDRFRFEVVEGWPKQEIRGVAKLRFGTDPTVDQTKPVDNGVMTVWSAAEPDA